MLIVWYFMVLCSFIAYWTVDLVCIQSHALLGGNSYGWCSLKFSLENESLTNI